MSSVGKSVFSSQWSVRSFTGSKSVPAYYSQQPQQVQPDNVRSIATAPGNWASALKMLIQGVLAQCQYGKNIEGLLSPERGFKAGNMYGDLMLLNYGEPLQQALPFKGVCNELAYSVGSFLKKLFSKNIVIQAARGACDTYFPYGTHYFLLAWPAAKQAKMTEKIQQGQGQIPDSCMLIDPSFNKLIPPKENSTERVRYRLEEVFDLDQLNLISNSVSVQEYPAALPIGYIRDLIPNAATEYGQQALLYLEFSASQQDSMDPPTFGFVFQRTPDTSEYESAEQLIRALPADHLLSRLASKIKADLTPPIQNTLDEDLPFESVLTPPIQNTLNENLTFESGLASPTQNTLGEDRTFESVFASPIQNTLNDNTSNESMDWEDFLKLSQKSDTFSFNPISDASSIVSPVFNPLEEDDYPWKPNFSWVDDLLTFDEYSILK